MEQGSDAGNIDSLLGTIVQDVVTRALQKALKPLEQVAGDGLTISKTLAKTLKDNHEDISLRLQNSASSKEVAACKRAVDAMAKLLKKTGETTVGVDASEALCILANAASPNVPIAPTCGRGLAVEEEQGGGGGGGSSSGEGGGGGGGSVAIVKPKSRLPSCVDLTSSVSITSTVPEMGCGGGAGGGGGGSGRVGQVEGTLTDPVDTVNYAAQDYGTCFSKHGLLTPLDRPGFLSRVHSSLGDHVEAVFETHREPKPEADMFAAATVLLKDLAGPVPCETLESVADLLALAACCTTPGPVDVHGATWEKESPFDKPQGRVSTWTCEHKNAAAMSAQSLVVVKCLYRQAFNVAALYRLPDVFSSDIARVLDDCARPVRIDEPPALPNHAALLELVHHMVSVGSEYDTHEALGVALFKNLSTLFTAVSTFAWRPTTTLPACIPVPFPTTCFSSGPYSASTLPKELLTAVSLFIAFVYGVGKTKKGATPGGADQLLTLFMLEWSHFLNNDLNSSASRIGGDTVTGNSFACLLALFALLRLPCTSKEGVLMRSIGWDLLWRTLDKLVACGGPLFSIGFKTTAGLSDASRRAIAVMYEAAGSVMGRTDAKYVVGPEGEKQFRFRPSV